MNQEPRRLKTVDEIMAEGVRVQINDGPERVIRQPFVPVFARRFVPARIQSPRATVVRQAR